MDPAIAPLTSVSARPGRRVRPNAGILVNDVHSGLNAARVSEVIRPRSTEDLQRAVVSAALADVPMSVAGGRHAMGGQQFLDGGMLVDTRGFDRVLAFDRTHGLLEVEAGAQWPGIVRYLQDAQQGDAHPWAIRQKQTGADRLSLGGAVSANIHGRGLAMRPFVEDVEALTVVDAEGRLRRCSRTEERELFGLVAGGYGMFGAIATVTLRLVPRLRLERVVELETVDGLMRSFEERIREGHLYGDFQFAVDPDSYDFLWRGILSTYRPVAPDTPSAGEPRMLTPGQWQELLQLAHTDKSRAFQQYAKHYLATSGQLYWSDLAQMSTYLEGYHETLDRHAGIPHRASEMIGEVYVPRALLGDFLDDAREYLRRRRVDVIYGTIRLIRRDTESFLAWARQPWACVVLNVHTEHTTEGVARTATAFRRLYDMALRRGGSYYLTYHRWARPDQLVAAHPRWPEFVHRKRAWDPEGRFQSDWWREVAGHDGMAEIARGDAVC